MLGRIWAWFVVGRDLRHLWVTLVETLLAFVIGTVLGVAIGLWLALSPDGLGDFRPLYQGGSTRCRG